MRIIKVMKETEEEQREGKIIRRRWWENARIRRER